MVDAPRASPAVMVRMVRRRVRLFRQLAMLVSVVSVAGCLTGCLSSSWEATRSASTTPADWGEPGRPPPAVPGERTDRLAPADRIGSFGPGPDGAPFCGTLYFGVTAPVPSGHPAPAPGPIKLLDEQRDRDEVSCTGGCGASSKWALLSAAIGRMVTNHPLVNWGLAPFGSNDACGVNAGVEVEVAADAAPSIALALAATTPGGDAAAAAARKSSPRLVICGRSPTPTPSTSCWRATAGRAARREAAGRRRPTRKPRTPSPAPFRPGFRPWSSAWCRPRTPRRLAP